MLIEQREKPSASLKCCCGTINYKIHSIGEHRNWELLGTSFQTRDSPGMKEMLEFRRVV